MRPDITIMDKNGNGILAEGLMHIKETTGNKEYVIYTLGEAVDPEQVKIYIAETSNEQGASNNIDDKEWDYIKKVMVSITRKEELPNVTQLPVESQTYNIGEPKKLAIKQKALNAFKEIKASVSRQNLTAQPQTETPQPGAFFDPSLIQQPVEVSQPVEVQPQINAFNTQFELIETPVSDVASNLDAVNGNIESNPTISVTSTFTPGITDNNSLMGESLAGNSLVGDIIETPNAKIVIEEEPQDKFADTPVIGGSEVDETVPTQTAKAEEPKTETVKTDNVNIIDGEVTKEDAIEAMVTIIKYMKVQKDLSSLLVEGINKVENQISEPQVLKLDTMVQATPVEVKPQEKPIQEIVSTVSNEVTQPTQINTGTSPLEANNVLADVSIEQPKTTIELVEIPTVVEQVETPMVTTLPTEIPEGSQLNNNVVDNTMNLQENATTNMVSTAEMVPEIIAPETIAATPTVQSGSVASDGYQNPMSFEATGTPVANNTMAQIIDTSVAGIQQAAPTSSFEEPLNPGATEVQFETPVINMVPTQNQTLQPSTPPPEYSPDYIPDATPQPVVEYEHQAQNNTGQVVINPINNPVTNGPEVIMPDNYKSGANIPQGNNAQLTLGPSGLGMDNNIGIAA